MGRHRFQTRAYEHHKQNGRELGKGWMFSFKDLSLKEMVTNALYPYFNSFVMLP